MPTTGAPGYEHASQEISGAGGSWTWTTSGAKARSSRRIFAIPVGEDAEVRDRAVGAEGHACAPSGTRYSGAWGLGRGTVKHPAEAVGGSQGASTRSSWPRPIELVGERLDVPVHAPRIGPGIGRDYGDAHRADGSQSGGICVDRAGLQAPTQKKPGGDREVDRPDHQQDRARVVGERADEHPDDGAEEAAARGPAAPEPAEHGPAANQRRRSASATVTASSSG